MTTYYLAEHVHTCLSNGHIVFLDIQNDRYSALPPEISKCLGALVDNKAINFDEFENSRPEIRAALTNLIDRGMLRADAPSTVRVRSRTVRKPRRDLSDANIEGRANVASLHTANFFYAYSRAVVDTKILSHDRVIRSLSRYNPRKKSEGQKYTLEEIVEAFRFIRIFFYREINRCYFDCIVHMYFLRRYGFDPVWVFGVQMEPFHAHCWVQVGDVLVTNYLGETSMLRPILTV